MISPQIVHENFKTIIEHKLATEQTLFLKSMGFRM